MSARALIRAQPPQSSSRRTPGSTGPADSWIPAFAGTTRFEFSSEAAGEAASLAGVVR